MSYPSGKLGSYIDILSGYAFKSSDFIETGVPVIKIKNITPPSVTLEDLSFVSEEIAEQQSKFLLEPDDVLIALTGSHINQMASVVGRVARVKYNIPSLLNQRVGKITILNPAKANIDYIYYYLSQDSVKINLASKAGGAANQANISPTDIKNLIIPFPDIMVQNKIASILLAYDNLIENNQKQIKLLEEAAQRLYKEWFIDLRFPGYETTPVHDGVPAGWEKTSIDSHITLYSGFAFKSSDFADKGQYKIVTIKNVKDAQFIGDNVSFIKEIPSQMPDHCKLSDGNILLSLTGNVGRVCLVFGENYLLNQRVAKLCSPFPGFTYCLFRSKDMFDAMSNLANGAAQQNLSPIRTGKLEALFPCSETVQQFENIVVPILQKIVLLNKEIVSAAQSRDRLLPKFMSGEIEV